MPHRRTAALALSTVTALVVLTACASTATPAGPAAGSSSTGTGAGTGSGTATAASSTGAAASPTAAPSATAPATTPATTPATAAGGGGAVTAVVSGLGGHPVLTPGGPALDFSVTVRNGTGQGLRDIQPLVSMGHCSCSQGGASMMPTGTLQLRNPASGAWQTVPYDAEGTGTDFSYVDQISGVSLAAGASETFDYRVALVKSTAPGSQPVRDGSATVDVTVQQLPAHTAFGQTVSTPVYVTTG